MLCTEPATLKLLLRARVELHRTDSNGPVCLHYAAMNRYPVPVVCMLLKAGADPTARNCVGHTPVDAARQGNN